MSDEGLQALKTMADKAKRMNELRGQLKQIPERLGEARRHLNAEQKLLDELQNPHATMEASIARKEATIALALETIEKFETHMRRVTTQKEYAAARKQVDEARRLNDSLQNEILEMKVKQDEISPKLQEQQERHAKVADDFRKIEAVILAEKAKIDAEMAVLDKELRSESTKLSNQVMPYYERLLKGGKFPPIVAVVQGKCGGCHISLPPHFFNQLLARNGTLFTCPNCARIIYHQPSPPPAEASAPAESAAS
jgi:predicted  nucleic acid-binding Zn-ribbon protein